MARTKIDVPVSVRYNYTSVIVSYSTGIDSTGALYWAMQNFAPERIYLLYCDTGADYPINEELFYKTAAILKVKPVLLREPRGFLGLLEARKRWPDSKNRWCTAYLKTGITDKWIRANRERLGSKVLFVSGERRDESRGRALLPEFEYHSTTLKTERKGKFECHWHRPMLDYEKGKMFEFCKKLNIKPHPCYGYIDRCSCMLCIFARDSKVQENMRRYPEIFKQFIELEQKIGHSWKAKKSLAELWEDCMDIDDVVAEGTE